MQAASSIELGQIQFVIDISCLYPTHVCGEAFLAAGQGSATAAEFQDIIDHSGIVWIAGRELWRIWAWRVPTPCRRELRREQTQKRHE
ncbi:MAG TPA: hypothetical protein VK788_04405 [Terriglobales bacterium]|nr:hypothetical protein [Terriglobales bacterium]